MGGFGGYTGGGGGGASTASALTNTPAGNIAATNVQDALNELDTEKLGTGGTAAKATILATARSVGGTSFDGSAPIEVVRLVTTEVVKTETGNVSAAECYNTIINNYGQGAASTLTLPAAAAGLSTMVIVGTTGNALHIKAGASDKIYLDGTALDDGDKASLATPVLADCAAFFTFQAGAGAYDWYCNTIKGLWTDGGA